MGNISSFGACYRRKQKTNTPPPPHPQQPPEISPNQLVFAPATQYTNSNSNHLYCQYPGYYPPIDGGRFSMMHVPYVDHQKAIVIHNNVNLIKKTLRLEPDPENPGRVLVSFTFDASVSGRITIIFFAKEIEDCKLIAMKKDTLPPITFDFEKGLGQKFIQPCGTGIELSVFEDSELFFNDAERNLYPLVIKGEAFDSENAQLTQVEYVKEEGEVKVKVLNQILWVNGLRYELEEIHGMRSTVDGCDEDTSGTGKECVVCLSEPRDVVVLPCRHMCMCSGCAKVTRFQTNLCPVCKEPAERLLEIEVNNCY